MPVRPELGRAGDHIGRLRRAGGFGLVQAQVVERDGVEGGAGVEQLQLAVGYAVAGDKTPEAALDDAWRAVEAEAARPRGAPTAPSGFDPVAVVPMALVALGAAALLWPRRGAASPAWLAPALVVIAALMIIVVAALTSIWALLGLVGLVLIIPAVRTVLTGGRGPQLIAVLKATGLVELISAVGFAVGLVIGR